MIVLTTIILSAVYVFFVIRYARKTFLQQQTQYSQLTNRLTQDFDRYSERKDSLFEERMDIESETLKIFTLYEMTKGITKSLSEVDAFEIFKQHLGEHVDYEECLFIEAASSKLEDIQNAEEYFVFTLKEKGKKIGYLAVKNVATADQEKVMILGHQYALALRRVHLYQEIERIAITDSLTDVYTRRHFTDRLKEEIRRSSAHKMELALLMVDVDHFKNVNDTYGHLTGDQVLREIAGIIKNNIREIDIPGRFGGEEFIILLPDTDIEGAKFVAERIRSAAEETHIKAYDAVVNATVSIGIATYPKDAKKKEELMDKADWTLYKAKRQGRNRVCVFGVE